jgi:hypothetical protein
MRLARTLGLAAGLAMVGSMTLAGGAAAEPIERGPFHDEFTDIIEDFCELPGLTVQFDLVVEGRRLLNPHGPDGLAYGLELAHVSETWTNVDNGIAVTGVERVLFKDLRATDNGDGTLTYLILTTGNSVVYGPDGKAIARNPGQIRLEFLIDHAGTPTDPSDDEFLANLGVVKGSTGRTDDFCAAVVPVLEG